MIDFDESVKTLINKGLGDVEGVRSYDEINAALDAGTDAIKTLTDGVNDLHDKVYGTEKKAGLIDKVADLDEHIGDIEAWIDSEGVIPARRFPDVGH